MDLHSHSPSPFCGRKYCSGNSTLPFVFCITTLSRSNLRTERRKTIFLPLLLVIASFFCPKALFERKKKSHFSTYPSFLSSSSSDYVSLKIKHVPSFFIFRPMPEIPSIVCLRVPGLARLLRPAQPSSSKVSHFELHIADCNVNLARGA